MKCYSQKFRNDDHIIISRYSPREVGEREEFSEWKEVPSRFLTAGFAGRVELIQNFSALTTWEGSIVVRPATRGGAFRIWLGKWCFPARLHDLDALLETRLQHNMDEAVRHINSIAEDRRLAAYQEHAARIEEITARIEKIADDKAQELLDLEGEWTRFLSGEWGVFIDGWEIIRAINQLPPAARDEVQRLLLEYDGFFAVAD